MGGMEVDPDATVSSLKPVGTGEDGEKVDMEGLSAQRKEEYAILEKQIAEHSALAAQPGKLGAALDALLVLEKQQRLKADIIGTKMLLIAVARCCFAARDWAALNEHLVLLSKRRAQLKQAIGAMVRECMGYVDQTPDLATKTELITTMTNLATGKIFLEVEKARLTRRLAKIQEEKGDLDAANTTMQEVAVETYGALSKEEKIAFILEQTRLLLDRGDFVRAQIVAKKINPRSFDEMIKPKKKKEGATAEQKGYYEATDITIPPPAELKLLYYEYMVRYHESKDDYLEMARCYQSIYQEEGVAKDEARWAPALKKIAWLVAMSKHGSMQQSLLAQTYADKNLKELSLHYELLKQFSTQEVIYWRTLEQSYAGEMAAEAGLFGGDAGAKRKADLKQRVVEHNVLVVAKYYRCVTLKRLSELLDLTVPEAEKQLGDMVSEKAVTAKIDRPAGVVTFKAKADADGLLNGWASSLEKLLGLVETASHKIHKEAVTHKVALTI
mmetsp:Transcript_15674/g.53497  ORF Transcript_15674/g.53497 Transcript_15674/m.53497 type:complete len:499 (+) Transcript_15674:237-1733(+)